MRPRINNYLKLVIREKPVKPEPGTPARIGKIRIHEVFTFDSHSNDFEQNARETLDVMFAEVAAASEDGLTASVSAFDVRPLARFLRAGEVLPEVGSMPTAWGLS
jgi:hypothetical protein